MYSARPSKMRNRPKATMRLFSSDVPSICRTTSLSTNAPIAAAASRVRKNVNQNPIAAPKADQAIKVVNMAIWPWAKLSVPVER